MYNYEKNLMEFLRKWDISFKLKGPIGTENTLFGSYYVYAVVISRMDDQENVYTMSVTFRDSIYNYNNDIKPSIYDVLSCLQRYDVGSYQDFIEEFGYDDSEYNNLNTYKAVVQEYEDCKRVFGFNEECWEEFLEIQ